MDKYVTALLCFSAVVVGFAFYCGAKTIEPKTVPLFLEADEVFQDDKVEEPTLEYDSIVDTHYLVTKSQTGLVREIADSGEYDDSLATRQRFLVLPDSLYELKMGQEYKLELFEDTVVNFTVVKRQVLAEGKYLVRGKVAGTDYGTASLVFYGDKRVAGNITIPGKKPIKIQETVQGVHRISELEIVKKTLPDIYKNHINKHGEHNDK